MTISREACYVVKHILAAPVFSSAEKCLLDPVWAKSV